MSSYISSETKKEINHRKLNEPLNKIKVTQVKIQFNAAIFLGSTFSSY